MKKDYKQELQNQTQVELTKRLEAIAKELTSVQLDIRTGRERNVRKAKALRYERAYIKTLIDQKNA
jgi:ribosomal protein L29